MNMAHCCCCHETFSSVALFDTHRVGGKCSHPSTFTNESGARIGEPKMRLNDHGTWVGNQPRPEFWNKEAA